MARTTDDETAAWRPRLHYTPRRHWINDPNGLFMRDGVYHAYYQHNPAGALWGDIGWGHAVSTDLLHWQERPLALPATDEEMVFSGCVVIDKDNTSGLAPEGSEAPALLAFYTRFDRRTKVQSQCLAYSVDGGESFLRWSGNPLVDIGSQEFRDPFVFHHAPSGRWVMLVALALEQRIAVYTSFDLLRWERASSFGPAGIAADTIWEVPVLVPLPVEGGTEQYRWVLFVSVNGGTRWGGSGVQYFIGDFDGERFLLEKGADPDRVRWADHGRDFYAPLPFAGLPAQQPVWLGWMANWDYARELPSAPWRGQLSLPRQLSLLPGDLDWSLVQRPARPVQRASHGPAVLELQAVRAGDAAATLARLDPRGRHWWARVRATREDISQPLALCFFAGEGQQAVRVGFDPVSDAYFVDRRRAAPSFAGESELHHAPRDRRKVVVEFEVWVDGCTVELFADGGTVVCSDLVFADPDSDGVALQHGSAHPVLALSLVPLQG